MPETPFAALAALAQALEETRSRTEMAARIATFLGGLAPGEVVPALRLLLGQVFPQADGRALNVSWAAVSAVVHGLAPASEAERQALAAQAVDGGEYVRALMARREPPAGSGPRPLEVYHGLQAIAATAGPGARRRKAALLRGLLERMQPVEAKLLVKDVFGEVRHGAGEGVVLEAVARASGVELQALRRAHMLWGDLAEVAAVALDPEPERLRAGGVRLFRPLKPMLAQTASSMPEALALMGGSAALEFKLDGARVQIHKDGPLVRIYSRQLSDVTESLPEIAAAVQAWPGARQAVLEGEAIAVDPDGRPLPFQALMRRFRRQHDVAEAALEVPVRLYLFDALYLDGLPLVDAPYAERRQLLEKVAAPLLPVPQLVPGDVAAAQAFAGRAAAEGHEGVMAKALQSPYAPGVRGRAWLKLKRVVTLDLAIVAADWGYGRRHGWLSNYHLAVRDDKPAAEAGTLTTLRALYERQFQAKGRPGQAKTP